MKQRRDRPVAGGNLSGVFLGPKGFCYCCHSCSCFNHVHLFSVFPDSCVVVLCSLPCSHPCVVSCLVTRRNTSVDESYEWDSVDPGADAEVLEAMSCGRSPTGAGPDRGVFSYDQTHGPQDQKRQGEPHYCQAIRRFLLMNRSPRSACVVSVVLHGCCFACPAVPWLVVNMCTCSLCSHPCITSRSPPFPRPSILTQPVGLRPERPRHLRPPLK